MSTEHQPQPGSHERSEQLSQELEAARREKLEELRQHAESEPDHAEKRAEAAREIINRQEQAPKPAAHAENKAPSVKIPFINHRLNYAQTLASVQRKLSPVSRTFSEVIHTPAIEKTSEVMEKTVARPSVVLGATWTALLVGGIFYFVARHFGYTLSGSEMLFSLIVGALLGGLVEGLWRGLRRR